MVRTLEALLTMNESVSMPTPQASRVAPAGANASGHAHALPPGARIGFYEVQRVLVQSACHTVYRAADHALALPVAIQEFLPMRHVRRDAALHLHVDHGADEARVSRGLQAFIDEARWLARADHPALVRVSQLIESNGTAYRVMPLYDGRRLSDARRDQRIAPDEATLRGWLLSLLGAVDALHQGGTRVHGAVSPSDILLLRDGRLVLLGPNDAEREISSDLVEALMAGLQTPFKPTRPVAAAASEPAVGLEVDVRAIAEVARFCITGEWFDGIRERVPLAATVARAQQAGRCPPYGAAFIAAIEAASAPPKPGRLPTVAQFRDALERSGTPASRGLAATAARPDALAAGSNPGAANGHRADHRPAPIDRLATHHDGPAFEGTPAFHSAGDAEPSFDFGDVPPGPRAPWGETALAPALARHAAVARRRRVALVLGGLGIVAGIVAAIAAGGRHWLPELGFAPPALEGVASGSPDPATPLREEPDAGVNPSAAARAAEPASGEPATALDAAAQRAQATVALAVAAAAAAATSPTAAAAATPSATPAMAAPPAPREGAAAEAPEAATTPKPTSKPTPKAASKAPAKAPKSSPPKAATKAPALAPAIAPTKAPAKPTPARATTEPARQPAPAIASAQPAAAGTETPRGACGPRSDFALYRCMQSQCRHAKWSAHAQCVKLRLTDQVN